MISSVPSVPSRATTAAAANTGPDEARSADPLRKKGRKA